MAEDQQFEHSYLKPFAFAPAFYLARRGALGTLGARPIALEQAARLMGVDVPTARSIGALLDQMGLATMDGDALVVSVLGRRILDPTKALEFVDPVFRFFEIVVSDLARRVRATGSVSELTLKWPPSDETSSTLFEPLMLATAPYVAAWLDELVEFDQVESLLDVGGGDGTIAAMLCHKHSHLRATVLNLPSASSQLAATAQAYDLGDRLNLLECDFREELLPGGFDLVTFARVLSDWDDQTVSTLLSNARHALVDGGRILALESSVTPPPHGSDVDDTRDHPWALFWRLCVSGFALNGPRTLTRWHELAGEAGLDCHRGRACGRLPFPTLTAIWFQPHPAAS